MAISNVTAFPQQTTNAYTNATQGKKVQGGHHHAGHKGTSSVKDNAQNQPTTSAVDPTSTPDGQSNLSVDTTV